MNFDSGMFTLNLWGGEEPSVSAITQQVRNTMLVTVFVFVGIEGASVYSRYAKKREDVGIATVLGFLGVLCLLILVTIPAYGVMLRGDLAMLPTPSMAGIFSALVGSWGAVFISVGLVVSILGNYLSWSLLAAEVLFSAARDKTMPGFLARENANKAPVAALLASNILIQVFLLLTPYAEYAFQLTLKMTSSMTLIPYLLVGAYACKLSFTGKTYEVNAKPRMADGIKATVATGYAFAMIYSGGMKYLLLSAILYFLGTVLFFVAKHQQNEKVFTRAESMLFAFSAAAAAFAVYALATGKLTI